MKIIPETMHTYDKSDQDRINMYVHTYMWKARRAAKEDLFPELGAAVAQKIYSVDP